MALFRPILESAVTRLQSAPELTAVPVLAMGVGEDGQTAIEERVSAALNQAGTSIEVALLRAVPETQNAAGPYFAPIDLAVRVVQNPSVELSEAGAGLPVLDLAEIIANRLHLFQDTALGNRVFVMAENGLQVVPDEQFHIVDLFFQIDGGLTTSA